METLKLIADLKVERKTLQEQMKISQKSVEDLVMLFNKTAKAQSAYLESMEAKHIASTSLNVSKMIKPMSSTASSIRSVRQRCNIDLKVPGFYSCMFGTLLIQDKKTRQFNANSMEGKFIDIIVNSK